MKLLNQGLTIIELLISMTIISVVIVVMFNVSLPIAEEMTVNSKDMRNYKQLLYTTLYLDHLYRHSNNVTVSGSEITFERTVLGNVSCKVVGVEFWCLNRPLLSLKDYDARGIEIIKEHESRHAELRIGKWIVRFGFFPNVFLI